MERGPLPSPSLAALTHLSTFILQLGLEQAHSVAILGFNAPEWFFSAVGTVFAG